MNDWGVSEYTTGETIVNSKLNDHLFLFYAATSFWTLFFLGGLWSNYYQQWSFTQQLIFVFIIPALILAGFAPKLIYLVNRNFSVFSSLIAALYFCIPLLLYDYIYLHLYQRQSFAYFSKYWYLTYFSLAPLVIFPFVAWRTRRKKMIFRI